MFIRNENRFHVLMNEAGAEGGSGSGGGEGGGEGGAGAGEGSGQAEGGQGGEAGTGDGGGRAALFGGEGDSKTVDLKEILGEDLAGNKTFEKFSKSENFTQDLAKSYAELEKQVGKQNVGVPGENATDEEKAAYYKAIGVPETSEEYGFEKPEGIPDDQYDEEHAKKWADIFKQNNVPAETANALRDQFMEEMTEQLTAMNADSEASSKVLDEAYTKSFGEKKGEVAANVKASLEKFIPDAEVREALMNKLPDEALIAMGYLDQGYKKTYGLGDQNAGDKGQASGQSMEGLREQAQKLMSSDAYRNTMHAEHKATVDKVNSLYRDLGSLTNQKK